MESIMNILKNFTSSYSNQQIHTTLIITVLLAVFLLSAYEFFVYRVVSHRAFYNKSFNICIGILPFFIATIILCLQSNLVITLGTIGALAIIRFRTAIKDPVDMLYILWSIHIGIVCGCQLYEVAILTSVVVTIVLIIMNYTSFGKKPFVLVLHCSAGAEDAIFGVIKENVAKYRVKSRNYTAKGMDYVIEFTTKEPDALTSKLRESGAEKFSIIEYDSEDIL